MASAVARARVPAVPSDKISPLGLITSHLACLPNMVGMIDCHRVLSWWSGGSTLGLSATGVIPRVYAPLLWESNLDSR